MQQPLAVRSAEFVEPGQVPIYRYSIKSEPPPKPTLATSAPFHVSELSLAGAAAPNE